MSQGAAQTDELSRRLEAAKTELKRLLGGCRRQTDVEMLIEDHCTSPATNGAEGGAAKSQHSERKSQRGNLFIILYSFPGEVKRNVLMSFKMSMFLTPANSKEYLNHCPISFNPVMLCTFIIFIRNF